MVKVIFPMFQLPLIIRVLPMIEAALFCTLNPINPFRIFVEQGLAFRRARSLE
jgi:hypothetical protein